MYASYGMQDITAKVVGPISYTPTECDTSAMTRALRSQVDADGGPFQHYIWYLGSKNDACAWSGLASVGTPDAPTRDTWYNASTSCVVLLQEPGHNFGMQHSSSLACGSAAFADDPNTCIVERVRRSLRSDGRRLPSHERLAEGLPGVVRRLQRRGGDGQRHVHAGPVRAVVHRRAVPAGEGAEGAAATCARWAAAVPRPPRTSTTTTSSCAPHSTSTVRWETTPALSARVLLHVAEDRHSRTQQGVHTYLLDMNPATTGTQGLNDAGAGGRRDVHGSGGRSHDHRAGGQQQRRDASSVELRERKRRGRVTDLHRRQRRSRRRVRAWSPASRRSSREAAAALAPRAPGGASGAAGTTGAAGVGGATGGSAPAESGLSKGCACDLSPSDAKLPSVLLGALGLVVVARRRRSRPRRVHDPRS